MKTIGLIGGMSWESSLEYYRIVNETAKAKLGGLHSAKCILYSVPAHRRCDCNADKTFRHQQGGAAGYTLHDGRRFL